jgi:hypothetical protein
MLIQPAAQERSPSIYSGYQLTSSAAFEHLPVTYCDAHESAFSPRGTLAQQAACAPKHMQTNADENER